MGGLSKRVKSLGGCLELNEYIEGKLEQLVGWVWNVSHR